jgi:DnaJ-class molecular chaperone
MNMTEALNILKPSGNNQDDLKTAYRQACKKYHPDINPDSLELMKLINCAYDFLKKHINKWSFTQSNDDTPLDEQMQDLFNKIKHFVDIKSELCGTWLWLSGETWRYKKELKEYGFKWASKKRQWYWSPAGYRKRGKKVFSMDEIRSKYGSVELEPELRSAIG